MVEVSAAVGRPQVCRDGQAVDVEAADHVTRRGDPGHHKCCSAAVVVEPLADGVFVVFPRTDVELSDLGDHVGQSVGGCFVVQVGLVLVGVQLTTFEDHSVGVVLENSLGVLKAVMDMCCRELLHLSGA